MSHQLPDFVVVRGEYSMNRRGAVWHILANGLTVFTADGTDAHALAECRRWLAERGYVAVPGSLYGYRRPAPTDEAK